VVCHLAAPTNPRTPRQGTGKGGHCETCNEDYKTCPGHFGFVKLALPIFHVGYFRSIIVVLQTICKVCVCVCLCVCVCCCRPIRSWKS
jgi:DNA-directed RNA polymerase III subunit RPC1